MDMEAGEVEVEELPCPRDLLRRLAGTSCSENSPLPSSDRGLFSASASSEMDLCLGLSLGGCFAVERSEKRLVRSSSIAALSIFPKERDFLPAASSPLARTCSLPVEANEENRKRKEMQSLKRLEAKRKREEKRTFSRPVVDGEVYVGVPPRASGGRPALSPTMLAGMRRSSSNFDSGGSRVPDIPLSNNNDSTVVGTNSSLPSTSDNIDKPETTTPPASALRSLRSLGEDDEAMMSMMTQVSKGMKTNIMEEMPCVSTKGDGPNGKRIEGFLYRYKKGEDVSIVCVCHGNFLTPAEFIKHAGGGDVDHPLRHIVVNPSSSLPSYY